MDHPVHPRVIFITDSTVRCLHEIFVPISYQSRGERSLVGCLKLCSRGEKKRRCPINVPSGQTSTIMRNLRLLSVAFEPNAIMKRHDAFSKCSHQFWKFTKNTVQKPRQHFVSRSRATCILVLVPSRQVRTTPLPTIFSATSRTRFALFPMLRFHVSPLFFGSPPDSPGKHPIVKRFPFFCFVYPGPVRRNS